ncbi:MerR family transcriptional regulator [Metabacillus fastidiosus]|uniref:MerR family transcriptional regulator n=1 Tax=Metabacillus fastidiosus TaxID=1458 RepID=A0ABU6P4W4_9BACI|nr:MerR family transcriptional regulator [Metabacillus fastidiosus]MED4403968.1 MerR family transcriptional regulator [Metabacillus fastidiosus]MED4461106.1 MerR family transcriptional regulator [Metabacillus fastidiosus]
MCYTKVKEAFIINTNFLINEAARMANMTSETLRHYDRIGLVKPIKIDPISRYRYYSEQEIIHLQIIDLLKQTGLSLTDIKEILELNDFSIILQSLRSAEEKVNEEIKRLKGVKQQLRLAQKDSEKKLKNGLKKKLLGEIYLSTLPKRAIILADSLEQPNLKNLWKFHDYFYEQMDKHSKAQITFEDAAGILTKENKTCLFAVCKQYNDSNQITFLPEGTYLCCYCTEESRKITIQNIVQKAKQVYGVDTAFIVQEIVFTGLIHWNYEIQVFLK